MGKVVKKALICAGGLGKRLGKLTEYTNKHLLLIGGETMIERLVRQLVEVGIYEIAIGLNGPFTKSFYEVFDSNSKWGKYVTLIEDDVVGGPGKTLYSMRNFVAGEDKFLCLMGDSVFFDGFPKALLLRQPVKHYFFNGIMCVTKIDLIWDDIGKYAQVKTHFSDEYGLTVAPVFSKQKKVVTADIQVPAYVFGQGFFEQIFEIDKEMRDGHREKGEITMTDITMAITKNSFMYAVKIPTTSYIDAGTPNAYYKANNCVMSADLCS